MIFFWQTDFDSMSHAKCVIFSRADENILSSFVLNPDWWQVSECILSLFFGFSFHMSAAVRSHVRPLIMLPAQDSSRPSAGVQALNDGVFPPDGNVRTVIHKQLHGFTFL